MNKLQDIARRLLAAAGAVLTTVVLFSTVVGIAEPGPGTPRVAVA